MTHVLNTAEQHVDVRPLLFCQILKMCHHHVQVSPGAFSLNKIQYYGFHVDDLPHANISRFVNDDNPCTITAKLFLGTFVEQPTSFNEQLRLEAPCV